MTRIRSFLAALILVGLLAASEGTALAATPEPASGLVPWHNSYYGYTIGYPATWRVLTPPDHIAVFLSPGRQSACQVNISVQAQQGTPQSTLTAAVPPGAVSVSHLTVAGAPAMSFWLYSRPMAGVTGRPDTTTQTVLVAQANSGGGVNLYTLSLSIVKVRTTRVDGSIACVHAFSQMVASLKLPSASHGLPAPAPNNLGDGTNPAVQYANKTWSWCEYNDSSNCSAPGAQNGKEECAEFVARSLAAEGLMPGLNANTSPTWGANSFGSYAYPAGSGNYYDLNDVGAWVNGSYVSGLYDYLINSGLGTSIGDNPAQASPGDVVFYYDGAFDPHRNPTGGRQHVTILTVTGGTQDGSDTLVDAHNDAALDAPYWNMGWPSWQIIHLSINNADDVYAIGNNGHLYDYHWTLSNGWSIPDLSNTVGLSTALTGTPSGNTIAQDGTMTQDVYAVGTNGVLYEFWWMNPSWHLTTLNPPAGVSFEGHITSISFALPGQTTMHHSVFVVGSNGDMYNYAYQEGGSWQLTDLTASLGPTCSRLCGQPFAFVGTPTAHTVDLSGVLNQDVYDVGNDGGVYEYWWDGSWHEGSPSGVVMPSDGAIFVNSPSAYSFVLPGSSNNHHNVFALGSDGHLYVYQWCQNCGGWSLTDLTALVGPSGVTFTGSPSGHFLIISGGPAYDTYVTSSNGQLYEYWYQNGAWHWGNRSADAGATGVTVTGSPSAFTNFLYGNPNVRHSIFVVTSDGHLREFQWVQNTSGWQLWDHGAPTGATLTGSPNAHSYTTF